MHRKQQLLALPLLLVPLLIIGLHNDPGQLLDRLASLWPGAASGYVYQPPGPADSPPGDPPPADPFPADPPPVDSLPLRKEKPGSANEEPSPEESLNGDGVQETVDKPSSPSGPAEEDSGPAEAKEPEPGIPGRNGEGNTAAANPDPAQDEPVEEEPTPPPTRGEETAPPPNPPAPPQPPPVSTFDTDLNSYVQEVIASYSGYYPYLLNNDYANYNGVTENLYYRGRLLAKAHPSGIRYSHCSGITFEVFFKAMQARNRKLGLDPNDFNGMTFEELLDFMLIWYVAYGNKRTCNIEVAIEKYGLGRRISHLADARAGDFADISRSNGTGHTVVFQNWVRDNDGNIIGIRYWSSQSSGIGYNTEYFDISGRGNVYFNQIYMARVLPVHQYKTFR